MEIGIIAGIADLIESRSWDNIYGRQLNILKNTSITLNQTKR